MPKTGRRTDAPGKIRQAPPVQKPKKLAEGLERVEDLIARRRWLEARNALYALTADYPRDADVLGLLVDANYELQDWLLFQTACEQLLEVKPDDADVAFALAGAYMENGMPALALRQFKQGVARFPYYGQAARAQKKIRELEGHIGELLIRFGVSGAEGAELAEQHERVQSLLHQNRYRECREAAERLLERWPRFTPALNNMSLACYSSGDVAKAIDCIQRVLDIEPENIHALGNLVHYATITGDMQQAEQAGARLKPIPAKSLSDFWVKKAEAFTMLGDDQTVLEIVAEAQQAGVVNARDLATLHHMAAVAELRLGHEHHARQNWKEALRILPGLQVAQDNLDDIRKPAEERNTPWAFPFDHWFVEDVRLEMRATLLVSDELKRDDALRQLAQHHPYLAQVAPAMLDRGNDGVRGMAFSFAMAVKSPEFLTALRDFGLGQRGPDVLRNMAVQAAMEAGLILPGMVRFWAQGKWQDVLLVTFEITSEPTHTYNHGEQVHALLVQASNAIDSDHGREAERLLKKALQIEPDAPDINNNLATAYQMQDRIDEMLQLVRQIHARYPDYFFARATLAIDHAFAGEIDEAQVLLAPLLTHKKLHVTEFRALCAAEVELELAQGKPDTARAWVDMLRKIPPESDTVVLLEQRIEAASRPKRWTRRR